MQRSAARRLMGELRADPAHAAETFVIEAVETLGADVRTEVAALRERRADDSPAALSSEVVEQGVKLAAVEAGISGTPLYLALVPAYVAMLLEQARMVLRIAALHGRTSEGPEAAADLLALRGVHPNVETAREAIDAKLHRDGQQARPKRTRGAWIQLGRAMLVLAGFIEAKELKTPTGRLKGILTTIAAGLVWALTWVVPITFILVMAWSGLSSTEKLGERALRFYGESGAPERPRRTKRWAVLIILSAGIPAGVLFAAARWQPAGVGLGHVLVAFAAVAVAIALFTRARGRI
jgi:hypothetical protein